MTYGIDLERVFRESRERELRAYDMKNQSPLTRCRVDGCPTMVKRGTPAGRCKAHRDLASGRTSTPKLPTPHPTTEGRE